MNSYAGVLSPLYYNGINIYLSPYQRRCCVAIVTAILPIVFFMDQKFSCSESMASLIFTT